MLFNRQWTPVIAGFLMTALNPSSQGETLPSSIVCIKQAWKLELYSVENTKEFSPQVVTGFKLPNHAGLFQIAWNHQDYPDYQSGGFQLQAWNGDVLLDTVSVPGALLSDSNKVVTWTQVISTSGVVDGPSNYVMQIMELAGTTWGQNSGTSEGLSVALKVDCPNLNTYNWQELADNTAIVKGTNRVKWLGVVETRYYDANGELITCDTTSRPVFQQPNTYVYYEHKQLDSKVDTTILESKYGDMVVMPVQQ